MSKQLQQIACCEVNELVFQEFEEVKTLTEAVQIEDSLCSALTDLIRLTAEDLIDEVRTGVPIVLNLSFIPTSWDNEINSLRGVVITNATYYDEAKNTVTELLNDPNAGVYTTDDHTKRLEVSI